MKHFYYVAPTILLFLVTACGSPNGSRSRGPQKKLSENFYGSFGTDGSVLDLAQASSGTSKSGSGQNEQNDNIQSKLLEEELKLEKERQKLLAAKTPTLDPTDANNDSNTSGGSKPTVTPPASRPSTGGSSSVGSPSRSSSGGSSSRQTSTNSSYTASSVGASSRPSSVNYQNYQYNSSYNYATSRGRLTVLNKADESKLKKYNVIIASLKMESGKNRLSTSFNSANENYFVARSGAGYYTFVVGSFEKRGDAIAYRSKIVNKYTSRYSENELFNTFGIIFTDAWILEI